MGKKKGFIGKFFDEVIKSVDSENISEKIKIVKDEYQKNLKEIKNQLDNLGEMNKETKINYVSLNEVSVIIKPKIQKSDGKIFFYDLNGDRVSKIPKGKRDISMENNCYLGLKKYNKTERWEPIKPDEVEKSINDDKFILNHSKPEKKQSKNQKKLRSEEVSINKKLSKDILELEDSLNKISNSIITNSKKNNDLTKKKEESIQISKKINISLNLCDILSDLPTQCCGSVVLYNCLNLNKDSFNETQFNNIVRFLSHVERLESNYRDLYVESYEKYEKYPEYTTNLNLISNLKILKEFYVYSSIIMLEFNRDLVLFNKVYNKLEDNGFFLSDIEKDNILTLKSIDKGISEIKISLDKNFSSLIDLMKTKIDLMNSQSEQFNVINNNLEYINGSLHMIDSSLGLIESNTDNIYNSI